MPQYIGTYTAQVPRSLWCLLLLFSRERQLEKHSILLRFWPSPLRLVYLWRTDDCTGNSDRLLVDLLHTFPSASASLGLASGCIPIVLLFVCARFLVAWPDGSTPGVASIASIDFLETNKSIVAFFSITSLSATLIRRLQISATPPR